METVIARYKEKNGNKVITVYNDVMAENPMHEYANFGRLWVTGNYALGHQHFNDSEALREYIADENPVFVFDFYYYDHRANGCTVSIDGPHDFKHTLRPDLDEVDEEDLESKYDDCHLFGSDYGTHEWGFADDQTGYWFITKEDLDKEFGEGWENNLEETEQKVKRIIECQVETYEKYLNGDVYGFIVTENVHCDSCNHTNEEHHDSCWGFYLIDDIWEQMEEKKEDFEEVYHI